LIVHFHVLRFYMLLLIIKKEREIVKNEKEILTRVLMIE